MNRRMMTRLGCATTVLATACALSACQPETVSGATAPDTNVGGTSGSAPRMTDPGPVGHSPSSPTSASSVPDGSASASSAPQGDTTPRAPYGPDGGIKGRSPRGAFGDHGGYLVDGTKVTFVYANGVRFTVDVGQKVDNPLRAKIQTETGTLTLRPTSATWTTKAGATSIVDRSGAGTIIDKGGVILVLGNGTSTCANADGLQFVGSNGDKATASKGGLFYVGPNGKKTSFAPKSGSKRAGQFTVCGIGDQVSMDLFSDVLFAFDKSTLTPAGKQVVKSAAATIKDDVKGRTVVVTGHTDSSGTPAANKRLGLKRAHSVANQLKSLIPGLHVTVRSAGQTQPIAANTSSDGSDNPDGRAKNRRVTITYTR